MHHDHISPDPSVPLSASLCLSECLVALPLIAAVLIGCLSVLKSDNSQNLCPYSAPKSPLGLIFHKNSARKTHIPSQVDVPHTWSQKQDLWNWPAHYCHSLQSVWNPTHTVGQWGPRRMTLHPPHTQGQLRMQICVGSRVKRVDVLVMRKPVLHLVLVMELTQGHLQEMNEDVQNHYQDTTATVDVRENIWNLPEPLCHF